MQIKHNRRVVVTLFANFSFTTPAFSADTNLAPEHAETRHGSIERSSGVSIQGGSTLVIQASQDKRVDPEAGASFDLVTTIPKGDGEFVLYVEGSTTPRESGVSTTLAEANADAGSALDRDGKGRLQVSEAHYFMPWKNGLLVLGLLDATASLDTSEVANDETRQFLGSSFVNNPTIDFPDYTLGAIYNYATGKDSGFTVALTSSHGLADNPNASYVELVDVSDKGKGLFAAAEAQWELASYKLHAGLWANTRDHAALDGGASDKNNYGAYLVIDSQLNGTQWNLRWGMANAEVSKAANFLAFAAEHSLVNVSLGVGLAYYGISSEGKSEDEDNTIHSEVYARFELHESLTLTPSIQWLKNSGFDGSGDNYAKNQLIGGARLNYAF